MAQQVDDHQVLRAVLLVLRQPAAVLLVLGGVLAARGRALDRLGLQHPVRAHRRVALRAAREQPGPRAGDVVLEEPGVRRGVELAQPQVRRQRLEVAGHLDPVGQVHLVGVAGVQALLDAVEGRAVGGRDGPDARRVAGAPRWSNGGGRVLHHPHPRRPHPHRVRHRTGDVGHEPGGQVGSAGVTEVAEPLVARVALLQLAREHLEDVVADDLRAPRDVPGHLAVGRGVGQGHVIGLEDPEDRAPPGPVARTAAVEPEAARRGGALPRLEHRVGHRPLLLTGLLMTGLLMTGTSRPGAARAQRAPTRGGTARPRAAARGAAPPSPRRARPARRRRWR